MKVFSPATIALGVGLYALALILGALGFQYIGHIPPCEMCHWQRWPLIAAAIVGIAGMPLTQRRAPSAVRAVAGLTIVLVATAGALGVFHAGVEWHWWEGPTACTGSAFTGTLDLNVPAVRCDQAAWRLFGLSLAGYNAIFSLAVAGIGSWLLANRNRTA